MLQTLKTARHQRRQEQRGHGAGTGPKHRRPESPAQSVVNILNIRRAIEAERYYRKEPSASHPSVRTPAERIQPEAHNQKPERRRRRALQAAGLLMVGAVSAAVAGGLAMEKKNADANPAAASQAGLAKQVEALARGANFAIENINGDNGNAVSQQGNSTEVNARLATGDVETVQITTSDVGPDGTVQPNSTHIVGLSLTRSQGTGSAITTKYSLIRGQWHVSQDRHNQGRDDRIETVTADGETHIQRSEISPKGDTVVITGVITAPTQVNETVASINAESSWEMAQLDQKANSIPPDKLTLL